MKMTPTAGLGQPDPVDPDGNRFLPWTYLQEGTRRIWSQRSLAQKGMSLDFHVRLGYSMVDRSCDHSIQ